jgi:hypothetical protein
VRRDLPPFEYYLTCDDDALYPEGFYEKVVALVKEYNPLIAMFPFKLLGHANPRSWCIRKIPPKRLCGVQRATASDECTVIWHRSVLEKLYPLAYYGSLWSVRQMFWIASRLYPEKCMRFSDLWVTNWRNRQDGPGHGPMKLGKEDAHALWNSFLKVKMRDRFTPTTQLIVKENVTGCKKPVSKEKVVIDDISAVVDESAPAWKNRKPLLPRFEKFVKKNFS